MKPPHGIPNHYIQTGPGEWSDPSRVRKAGAPRLCPDNQEPVERRSLVSAPPRENPRWYGSAERFEITFTIYSQRPCDYDGYSIKELQDMVVHAGIIPNDKWNVLSGRCISRKAHTKEEEKTVIEITKETV